MLAAGLSVLALAFGITQGWDPGLLFCGCALSLAAALTVLSWRPWALRARTTWIQASAFCLALGAGWLAAYWALAGPLAAAQTTASGLLFAGGLCLGGLAPQPPYPADAGPSTGMAWTGALLPACGFYPMVFLLRDWVRRNFMGDAHNSIHLFYMPRTGYEGIPSAPFGAWGSLAWPALWWTATLACAAWAWQRPESRRIWVLPAAAFTGKLALASLSGSGMSVLPQKITAVSTAYYNLAGAMDHLGVWPFIRNFNAIQPGLGTHGVSHPFGPELFYWILARGLDTSPWVPALCIAALTSVSTLLLRRLAMDLGAPPRAGLAIALLYLSTPASGILSESGIDSMVSLLFLCVAWLALRSVTRSGRLYAPAAGLLLFICSLMTFAAAYLVAMLAAAGLLYWLRKPATDGAPSQARAPERWSKVHRAAHGILGLCLLLHLLLWLATGGAFNYPRVYAIAAPFQFFVGARPLYLWSWLNPLLYLGFVGAGCLVLAMAAAADWALKGRRPDLAALIPLAFLGAAWLQGQGLGECQRIFHWGYAGLCLLALSTPLARWEGRRGFAALSVLASLNALSCVLLMATVMDYW
jgi:hypothetical protein